MIERLQTRLGSKASFWGFALAGALLVASTIALALTDGPAHFRVPLHATVEAGVDLTGPWWSLYYLPALGLLILGINLILAIRLRRRGRVLTATLTVATILVQVLLLIETLLFLSRL